MLFLSSADFFLKNIFHEHYRSVKQFGSRSGAYLNKGYQQTTQVTTSKERINKQMLNVSSLRNYRKQMERAPVIPKVLLGRN